MIEFSPPDIGALEIEEVCGALRSGWITTGERVERFERRIAEYTGAQGAVCMSSATAALEMTLRMLGIGEGDEVIVPAYTYTATAAAVLHTGAVPVMADCAPGSYLISPEHIAALLNVRTKAVIPADIGGAVCDYDAIYRALGSHGGFEPKNELQSLFGRPAVIADAAHSFGSRKNDRESGWFADFTCFSFHAVKNLTTAEGGCVVWRGMDGLDAERIRSSLRLLTLHGQTRGAKEKTDGRWEYDIVLPGWKCNMTDIQASLGLAQLERYNSLLRKRRRLSDVYDAVIAGRIPVLEHSGEGFEYNRHLYMASLPEEVSRDGIIDAMRECGISCNVHFKPLPLLSAYRRLGYDHRSVPNAVARYNRELSLPLHTKMSESDAEYAAKALCGLVLGG